MAVGAWALAAAATAGAEADGCPAYPLIEGYRLNYFQLYGRDGHILGNDPTEQREPEESQFQISFKKRMHDCVPLYLGYTQRSFWQFYDEAGSRPFRETNYAPELFVNTPNWRLGGGVRFGVQAGLAHQSNGRGIETIDGRTLNRSRSWNRYYGWPRLLFGGEAPVIVAVQWWGRVPEDPKTDPLDADGDDNPLIQEYLGHAALQVLLPLPAEMQLNAMFRKGRRDDKGTTAVDWLFHLPGFSENVFVHLRYFYGFGESLIDYDRSVKRLGIGFAYGDPRRHYERPYAPAAGEAGPP